MSVLLTPSEAGDWEGWLRFFLRGVAQTAEEATAQARAIVQMREAHRARIQELGMGVNALPSAGKQSPLETTEAPTA